MESKPDWDDYFMNVAKVVEARASCLKRRVGAVLVRDKQIISAGYNGTPKGTKNCDEGGCKRCARRVSGEIGEGEELGNCVCCHAEENAIIQAALHGTRTEGATLYTTLPPCTRCAKMIINAGIKKIVAIGDYRHVLGEELFKEAGIGLIKYNGKVK